MFKTYKQMQKACMCISCFVRSGKWLKRLCSLRFADGLQLREAKDQFSLVAQSCPALCDPMEACQASLSITNTRRLPKLMSTESVMPSNHLILCCPLLLLPLIFPSIRVLSNESALPIRWPKYWSFSFNISPSSEHPGLISFRMDWLDLLVLVKHCGTLALVGCFCYSFSNFTRKSQQSRCQSWVAGIELEPGASHPVPSHVT